MSHQENISRIRAVNNALASLKESVVFVGGATVSLYAERPTEDVRPTEDIDVIIELWAYKDYSAIDERLRNLGFVNDQESGVICRYTINGIIVDVMPTSKETLGFSNRWYPSGFANSIVHDIGEGKIRIFKPSYFIASKIEAFKSRGSNDGRTSTDFEDIIFVLENNSSIWEEMKNAEIELKQYLKSSFQILINNQHFEEWVDAHAGYSVNSATQYILERLKEFTNP
jgi:hypothetical protein